MVQNGETRTKDVLLVEDSPGDVVLLREAFEEAHANITLHVVEDGEQALDFIYRRKQFSSAPQPDLILLDLNLPKVDGRAVLSEVKKDAILSSIPIIVLTTSQAPADITKCYELHGNCFISKPIDFERFSAIVRLIDDFWLGAVSLPLKSGGSAYSGPR